MHIRVMVSELLCDALDRTPRRGALAILLRSAAAQVEAGDGETFLHIETSDRGDGGTVIEWSDQPGEGE